MAQGTLVERRRYWHTQVMAWQASGLGVTAFAREHGLNLRSLLYWRRSLRRHEQTGRSAGQAPLFQRLEVVSEPPHQGTVETLGIETGTPWATELPCSPWQPEPPAKTQTVDLGAGVRSGDIRCQVHLPNGARVELTGMMEAALLGNLLQVAGNLPVMAANTTGGRP